MSGITWYVLFPGFFQHNRFSFHPHYSVHQACAPLYDKPVCCPLPVGGHLWCGQGLLSQVKLLQTLTYKSLCEQMLPFVLGKIARREMTRSYARFIFNF